MKNLATVAQAFERPLPTGEKPEEAAARQKKIEEKQADIKQITDELRAKVLADARANVAAYLLATADARAGPASPAWHRATCPGRSSSKPRSTRRGRPTRPTPGTARGSAIILSYDPTHTRAEYAITVPKAGEYELELRYAALESRPVRVSVDGKVVLPRGREGDDRRLEPGAPGVEAGGPRPRFRRGRTRSASRPTACCRTSTSWPSCRWSRWRAATATRPSAGTLAEVAQQRKLIVEFVTGWADYLRQVKADDPVFGPWRASRTAGRGLRQGGRADPGEVPVPTRRLARRADAEDARRTGRALRQGAAATKPEEAARRPGRAVRAQDAAARRIPELYYPAGAARLSEAEQRTGGDPQDGPARGHGAVRRGRGEVPGSEGRRPAAQPVRAGPRQLPDARRGGPAGLPAHPGRREANSRSPPSRESPDQPNRIRRGTAMPEARAGGWNWRSGSPTRSTR